MSVLKGYDTSTNESLGDFPLSCGCCGELAALVRFLTCNSCFAFCRAVHSSCTMGFLKILAEIVVAVGGDDDDDDDDDDDGSF